MESIDISREIAHHEGATVDQEPSLSEQKLVPSISETGKIEYSARRGKIMDRELYKCVGKEYTPEIWRIVIHWNADWLQTQDETNLCPPISEYFHKTRLSYRNNLHFYNTYMPLRLLSFWHEIYECKKNQKGLQINCTIDKLKEERAYVKLLFTTTLKATDAFPKEDDIAICIMKKSDGDLEEVFIFIKSVLAKGDGDGDLKKLEIHCRSAVPLAVTSGENITIHVLGNVGLVQLQCDALYFPHEIISALLLHPEHHTRFIEIVRLEDGKRRQDLAIDIGRAVMLSHVCLVDISTTSVDIPLLLTHLVYVLLKNCNSMNKILVILKNEEVLPKLYFFLKKYKPVIDVPSEDISISESETEPTAQQRLSIGNESKEDIAKSSSLFITTFSDFHVIPLLKKYRVTCIIQDAHTCTEAETSMPLSLNIVNLILLGKPEKYPGLPELLQQKGHDISLFMRLIQVIQKQK